MTTTTNAGHLARRFFWPVVAAAIALAAANALLPARSPAKDRGGAEDAARTSSAGLVCFGTVDLDRGVAALAPLQPGRVTEVVVRENESVARNAELVKLDDSTARSRLAEAEAGVRLSRHQLDEAKSLFEKHHKQVEQQEAMIEAAKSRVTAAQQVQAQRQRTPQQTASEPAVREAQALERAEELRLAVLKADDPDAAIRRAELELAAAEARRDQARIAVNECILHAPAAGTVLRINVAPGDLLGPTGGRALPAVLFAADGPQVVRATVEQEFAPRIREGMAAVVHDEADDGPTWRGTVDHVGGWYSQRRAVLHDPSELSDVRTLECVIVLEPGQPRLRLGQSVRVHVGPASQ